MTRNFVGWVGGSQGIKLLERVTLPDESEAGHRRPRPVYWYKFNVRELVLVVVPYFYYSSKFVVLIEGGSSTVTVP